MKTIVTSKYLDFKSTKSPSNNDWYYVKRTNDSQKHDSAVVITTLVKLNNEYNFSLILHWKRRRKGHLDTKSTEHFWSKSKFLA